MKKRNYACVKNGEMDGGATFRVGSFFHSSGHDLCSLFTLYFTSRDRSQEERREGGARERDLHLVSPTLFAEKEMYLVNVLLRNSSVLYPVRARTKVTACCVTIVRHGHTFVRYRK